MFWVLPIASINSVEMLKLYRSCPYILFLFFFFRLIRRDKVRPPTEPHYNNSTQLRKKEHHKHVKMFLLGRNESVGMYPQIHPSPFVFKSSKNHVVSISWFSIAASTKPNGCNLYSVLNLLCCWISQCEKKKCDVIILNLLIRETSDWHSFAVR